MSKIDDLKELITKWEAEEKKEPYIEPCPICGGKMKRVSAGYIVHVGEPCEHVWGFLPIESYNVISRVLREAVRVNRCFEGMSLLFRDEKILVPLLKEVENLKALQAKVKEVE